MCHLLTEISEQLLFFFYYYKLKKWKICCVLKKLKYLVIKKILSAHRCFNEANNKHLCLPKNLLKELVQVGPGTIEIPKYSLFNDKFLL